MSWNLTVGNGKYRVSGQVTSCGKDVLVNITGGTRPHIGAVAIGQPRPSLENPNKNSASTSMFCVIGHKDDRVAMHAADSIAAACGCTVAVSAGIHIDDATGKDIEILWENSLTLINRIIEAYQKERFSDK